MNLKQILSDAVTYIKIQENKNYKDRLMEAYNLLSQNGIKTYEEFEKSNIGIGAFKYSEITIFDRLNNEEYYRALSEFYISQKGILNLPDDYGDRLASYGIVGNTPYRDELIKRGFVTTGLTKK